MFDPVAAFQDAAAGLLNDNIFMLPLTTDPINYRKALKLVQRRHWQVAINTKIATLERLGVWEKYQSEDIPAGHNTIGLRFTLHAKTNKQGKVVSYKACLVVQGNNQPKKLFKGMFTPTAKFSSIRLLLAIIVKHGYNVHQCDVNLAFPQAELNPEEVVFIRLPEGLRDLPAYTSFVLCLCKALYGLKQSASAWNLLVHKDLTVLGYRCTCPDACIYVRVLANGCRST